MELTSCGAQPRASNYTIDKDGVTLRPYRPCYWQSLYVNFNGSAYYALDMEWVLVKPSRFTKHYLYLAQFTEVVDMSSELLSSALEREHSIGIHLLAELAGAVEDHALGDVGEAVHSATLVARKMPDVSSWLHTAKKVVFGLLGAGAGVGVLALLWQFRSPLALVMCGMFRRLRNRWQSRKKRSTVVTQSHELEELRASAPGDGSTAGGSLSLYPTGDELGRVQDPTYKPFKERDFVEC